MLSGNNLQEVDIEFERINDVVILSSFFCGIPKLDKFIHTRLQYFMDTVPCETFVVRRNKTIVALLSLKEDLLVLDDDDKDDMKQGFVDKPQKAIDVPSYLTATEFPSIEIAYLAVSKDYREHGIGRYIIEEVERKVRREHPDYEFITVDAYMEEDYSAVGFYSKCGFEYAEYPHGGYKDTLRMYKVLAPVVR